jgi:hypothetical protein
MFCLQNGEKIFIPSLPGYPIWRPETGICDWKLSQKRIYLIYFLLFQTVSNTERISYIPNWKTLLPTYSVIREWFFVSQIQYGDRQTGSTSISGSTLDASEIPKVTPMFPWTIGTMACTSMSYMFSSICRIQYGGRKTGSSYNYASERDRNAILTSRYRFLRMPRPMEHQLTWSSE